MVRLFTEVMDLTAQEIVEFCRGRTDDDCKVAFDLLDETLDGDLMSEMLGAAMADDIDSFIAWSEQVIRRHDLTKRHFELVALACEWARRRAATI